MIKRDNSNIVHGKQIADELVDIISQLSDSEVGELLIDQGVLNNLLKAILLPSTVRNYPKIADFLFANKTRVSLLALLRHVITINCSFKGTDADGKTWYVSPWHIQFFDDGVLFTEGEIPFQGLIGLYRNGKLGYAISSRDVRSGEEMGREYFEFIDIEDFKEYVKKLSPIKITQLDEPLEKLKNLLNSQNNNEAEYQQLLQDYPWVLGAKYSKIQRHEKLDDENIPDFTGVRVHDDNRDIFELKPPFMKIANNDGLGANFRDAWDQAERYLNFSMEEKDYLRRKGLIFDNPKCYLILGYNLPDQILKNIRIKQKFNPMIELLTYNDLLAYMGSTIGFVKSLKGAEIPNNTV